MCDGWKGADATARVVWDVWEGTRWNGASGYRADGMGRMTWGGCKGADDVERVTRHSYTCTSLSPLH